MTEASGDSFVSHVEALEESQDSTEMVVRVTYEEAGYFSLTFVKAATADLKDKDCEQLSQDFENFFWMRGYGWWMWIRNSLTLSTSL